MNDKKYTEKEVVEKLMKSFMERLHVLAKKHLKSNADRADNIVDNVEDTNNESRADDGDIKLTTGVFNKDL